MLILLFGMLPKGNNYIINPRQILIMKTARHYNCCICNILIYIGTNFLLLFHLTIFAVSAITAKIVVYG